LRLVTGGFIRRNKVEHERPKYGQRAGRSNGGGQKVLRELARISRIGAALVDQFKIILAPAPCYSAYLLVFGIVDSIRWLF
jgi:hypothetical protein